VDELSSEAGLAPGLIPVTLPEQWSLPNTSLSNLDHGKSLHLKLSSSFPSSS